MSEKIAIITDSCSDIPKEYIDRYPIYVIPLLIMDGDKIYKDNVDITVEQIYEIEKTRMLKTASPKGEEIIKVVEQVKKDGYTHVICMMLSSGLSGTYNQMRIIAEGEDDIQIEVFDTRSGSIGYGSMCIQLCRYIEQGLNFEECLNKVNSLIVNTKIYFLVDSLDLLEKGGRVGKASYLVGSALKVKPILSVDLEDGYISNKALVRGSKKMNKKFFELLHKDMQNHPNMKYNILISDGGMPEEKIELEKEIKEEFPDYVNFINSNIGGLLSCYIGKGVLGAAIQFLDD